MKVSISDKDAHLFFHYQNFKEGNEKMTRETDFIKFLSLHKHYRQISTKANNLEKKINIFNQKYKGKFTVTQKKQFNLSIRKLKILFDNRNNAENRFNAFDRRMRKKYKNW